MIIPSVNFNLKTLCRLNCNEQRGTTPNTEAVPAGCRVKDIYRTSHLLKARFLKIAKHFSSDKSVKIKLDFTQYGNKIVILCKRTCDDNCKSEKV